MLRLESLFLNTMTTMCAGQHLGSSFYSQVPGMPSAEKNVSDLMHKLLVFQEMSSHASLKFCPVQPRVQQELLHWQYPGLHLHQVLQRGKQQK